MVAPPEVKIHHRDRRPATGILNLYLDRTLKEEGGHAGGRYCGLEQ
jgi:hypothetical protein